MEAGDIILYVTVFFGLFTSIFFLLTLVEKIPQEKKRRVKKYEKACIIIPCYNEEATVAKTIESLLEMEYPRGKLEIVVVDDGSKDKTYEIAKRYRSRGVTVLQKRNGGKYTALNYALKRTDAVFVGALDADSFVDKKALKRIVPYFNDPRVMAVTPSMKVSDPKMWLQRVQWTEYLLGIFLRKVFALMGAIHVTPGPFSIYKREFFLKHGFYKLAHHTEDIEMALRIQAHNYEIENAHDAYVYTVGPDSFKALWNQRLRWYHGFIRNVEDYKELFRTSHGALGLFILPASFFSVVLVIVGISYALFKLLSATWDKWIYLRAVGFDIFTWEFAPDLFFFSMDSAATLGWIALLTGIVVILTAKKVAGEKRSIVKDYLWFLVTYWVLFGVWWIAAFYSRVAGKRVTWRHKSET